MCQSKLVVLFREVLEAKVYVCTYLNTLGINMERFVTAVGAVVAVIVKSSLSIVSLDRLLLWLSKVRALDGVKIVKGPRLAVKAL